MPIYEYECPKCGRFDVLQKMSSPGLELHDACGSKVTKLMSACAKSPSASPSREKKAAASPGCAGCPNRSAA